MSATRTRIRLFVMDVDGTLTDGTITYTTEGTEIKSFHARDGAGIRLLPNAGIRPAIVSGRDSPVTARRARELGIEDIVQGAHDKIAVVDELRRGLGLEWSAVAFMGDDLSDLPVMLRAGYSAAPADADAEVRRIATYVCGQAGGRGAVREAIEMLLRDQESWDPILRRLGAVEGEEVG